MKIKNYFDDFTFYARVQPILTVVFPILLVCIIKGMFQFEILETGALIFVIVVVITFGANIIRELGKNYEEKIFKELGAKPTTIVLRFTDDRINIVSKTRYHKWFNVKYKELKLPVTKEAEGKEKKIDEKYASAMDILRNTANCDRNKFPRVYQELKKYNYWRNLRGCKWYALLLYLFVIVVQVLNIQSISVIELVKLTSLEYILLLGMLIWSFVFCIIVSKQTVLRNSFDYAKALVEIIEILDKEQEH